MKKPDGLIDRLPRGMYFQKKQYDGAQLKSFAEVKDRLPKPILSGNQEYLDCYWYAVQLAFKNSHQPTKESGFVSNFVDAAFNENIFMWDTAFITMYCNLFHNYLPGICSLDNFYCKQLPNGEIARELVRATGKEFPKWVNVDGKPLYSYFHNHYGYRRLNTVHQIPYAEMSKPDLGREVPTPPYLTLDALNHPIMVWAEYVSFLHTGDLDRLELVVEPLFQYFKALWTHIRHANHLYVTDWASMDNSPRNKYLGCAVDTSCEMVLFAEMLLKIMDELQRAGRIEQQVYTKRRAFLKTTARLTKDAINNLMWDEDLGFYFDLKDNQERAPVKTIAAYWALISGVADEAKAQRLVEWLNDPHTFNRLHRVPVCAADEEGYDPEGGYWRGAVWAPTNTMVISGLLKYGYEELAREIALNHLDNVVKIFTKTGTIWENYPPDFVSAGQNDKGDFVGWSGLGPILYLIAFKIGLKANALKEMVEWSIADETEQLGCENYWFFGKTASFYATKADGAWQIKISTGDQFKLRIKYCGRSYDYQITGDTTLVVS